jgi:hypothetical protein
MLKSSTAVRAIDTAFNKKRRYRRWQNTHFGGMEAVKAHPLSVCRFRPDEGGMVTTNLNIKLAPVSGFMRSKAYVDVVQVFVPYQAMELLEIGDAQQDAGVTEMARRRLMAGQGIGLGGETAVSRAMNVHPKSVGGVKMVNKTVHLAYIAAVNHLRKSAYYAADTLPNNAWNIAPAVLTSNVLERFNGVLDPERNIDGGINLTGSLPIKGIAVTDGVAYGGPSGDVKDAEGEVQQYDKWAGSTQLAIEVDDTGTPQIRANLSGTSEITLRDMMESQVLDGLIREFARLRDADPINGEEVIARALYGLSVDYDHNCQVMYRNVYALSPKYARPTDGPSINDVSTHYEMEDRIATVVPRSELGGQLVTIAMVKPLETLSKQPDPAQTEAWELVNRVHDETQLEEVLLRRSDLESDVLAADEDTPVFWTGQNAHLHEYVTQGPNERQTSGVEMKSSMWTYPIPTSVTPENINYPEAGVDMYPFFNWNGAHAEYTIAQSALISTSLAKGPNPVEKIQLFSDDPTLIGQEPGGAAGAIGGFF